MTSSITWVHIGDLHMAAPVQAGGDASASGVTRVATGDQAPENANAPADQLQDVVVTANRDESTAQKTATALGSALIAPELFAAPTFRLGLSMTVLFATATNGFLLVLSMVLQRGLGITPRDTAMLHVPFGLGVMAGVALTGPRVLPRVGAWLLIVGAVMMALGLAATAAAVNFAPVPGLIAATLALSGIGMG